MRDIDKTKGQLINELVAMRQRISELETMLGERDTVEEALQESIREFGLYFETITDVIYSIDPEFRIISVSPSVERILGYKPEELVGRRFQDSNVLAPEYLEKAVSDTLRVLAGEGIPSTEYEFIAKDGTRKFGEISGAPVIAPDGKITGLVSIARDITERKRAEEALEESEENFRALAENSLDAITVFTEEGVPVYANKRAAEITGYSIAERTSKTFLEFVHHTEAKKLMARYRRRLEGKPVPSRYETVIVRKDGRSVPIELAATRTVWRGKPAVLVVYRDIAERKLTEDALRNSEEKLRLMFESVDDGIAVTDLEGTITEVNSRGLELYGASTKSEVLGKSAFELIAPPDRESALAAMQRTLEQGASGAIEYTLTRADGSEYLGELDASLLRDGYGNPAGFIAIVRDITERKKAEDALRKSEERYRNLIESALDSIHTLSLDGTITSLNRAFETITGWASSEWIGKQFTPLIHPEDLRRTAEAFQRGLEGGEFETIEARILSKSGEYLTMEFRGAALFNDGELVGFLGVGRDITERKKAEEALRVSEHNYRVLFESTIYGTAVIDAETMKVVLANQTAAKMYGFDSMEDVVEANLVDYIHPDDRDRALTIIAEDLFEKDLRRVEEFRTLTKDGGVRWIAGVGTRVEYQGRLAGLISFRDITEQKRTDERLRELYEQERESRQRVEAEMKRRVEFTRALAHELKTPLTSVLASSDLLASELHDEPLLSLARNISQGASSLNSRIDELLDLARGEVGMLQLKLEPVDLLQLLRDTADSMRPLASSRGQSLTLDLPPSLPPVRADAARVQQVVTNLLGNAFKFTPVAGSITLRAKEKDAALVVEVRDTGPGMSKEEQKRLFEPYHRLHREPPGGLGLGLSLCKTLVELHGGQIWVRSNVGRGSTFGFSLPLEAADEQAVESEMPTKLWKVLIIEDDQEIVSFVSVAFQMRWPEAQLISSSLGEEGLELVETENPDLVILDLGLPDTSGFEVLRQIRLFSSVPVVILTVRADEADMVKGLEWGADDYVVKPFRQLELLARLKVQLRKQIPPGEEAPIICGSLRLDPSTYQLTYGGKEISLTIVEGHIMQYLMQNAGHVITHSRLAEAVWEEDHPGAVDSLRVYIRYLREKLEEDPSHPQLILTKVGIGYLLAKSV